MLATFFSARRPKRLPRRPKRPPRALPRGHQEAKISDFTIVFDKMLRSRLFGFPTLQNSPRRPQDRPKTAQEASKRAPRQPKRAPRRPKRSPRRPKRTPGRSQEGAHRGNPNGHFDPSAKEGDIESVSQRIGGERPCIHRRGLTPFCCLKPY